MNLTKWQIYKNGTLVFETSTVSDDGHGGFYFDAPKSVGFAVGVTIVVVLPPGTPAYTCQVKAVKDIEGKAGYVQVWAKQVGVDMGGIKR